MRMSEGPRLSTAVAAGLTAVVLLVLAGPALTRFAAREYLKPDDGPSSTPCALKVGPVGAYCFSTTTPPRSAR